MRGLPRTSRAANNCGASQPKYQASEIEPMSVLSEVKLAASAGTTVVMGMKYVPMPKNIESPPKAS